eukprot:Rmarinus@m.20936
MPATRQHKRGRTPQRLASVSDNTMVLVDDITQGLTCTICEEVYDEDSRTPRSFPCLHTFCTACVEKWLKTSNKCPNCCRTADGVSTATDLVVNFGLTALIPLLKKVSEQERLGDDAPTSLCCMLCGPSDGIPAESFCGICHLVICKPHVMLHQKIKATKDHVLCDVAALSTEERKRLAQSSTSNTATRVTYCPKHRDQQFVYYCSDCDDLVCLHCYNINHKEHKVAEIDVSLAEKRIEVLNRMAVQVEQLSVANSVDKESPLDAAERIIDRAMDVAVQTLTSERKRLKETLTKTLGPCLKAYSADCDRLARLQSASKQLCSRWETARNTLSPIEILVAYPGLCYEMEQMLGQRAKLQPEAAPLVNLALPAINLWGGSILEQQTEKKLDSFSTAVPIPAQKGQIVCLDYDDFRHSVWVCTNTGWIGQHLLGIAGWVSWFQLPDEKGVHDFVMVADGRCFVIPSDKKQILVYGRGRSRHTSIPSPTATNNSNPRTLQSLSNLGDGYLLLLCHDSTVYVINERKLTSPPIPVVTSADVSSVEGRISWVGVTGRDKQVVATVITPQHTMKLVEIKLADALSSGWASSSSGSAAGLGETLVTHNVQPSVRDFGSIAVAGDPSLVASFSRNQPFVYLHTDARQPEQVTSAEGNVVGVACDQYQEVFICTSNVLVVLDSSTLRLDPISSGGAVRSLGFASTGSPWIAMENGSVYSQVGRTICEIFSWESKLHSSQVQPILLVMGRDESMKVCVSSPGQLTTYHTNAHSVTVEAFPDTKGCLRVAPVDDGGVAWLKSGANSVHFSSGETVNLGTPVTSLSGELGGRVLLVGGSGVVFAVEKKGDRWVHKRYSLPSMTCRDACFLGDFLVVGTACGAVMYAHIDTDDKNAFQMLLDLPLRFPDLQSVAASSDGRLAVGLKHVVRYFDVKRHYSSRL